MPASQPTSGSAVVSVVDAPVITALSALTISPASAAIPASAATPASAEITSASVDRSANQRALAPPTQYVQVGEKAPKLSAKPSWQEVQRVSEVLLSNGTPFRPVDVVHHSNFQSFKTLLQLRFATDPDRRDSCNNWRNWTNQNFCRELNLAIPATATSRTDKLGFIESITQVQIQFDLKNPSVEEKTDQLLADIVDAFPEVSAAMQLTATKILIDKLPAEPINWRSVLYRTLDRTPRLITVDDFRFVWRAQLRKLREAIDALRFVDVHPTYGDHSRQIKNSNRPPQEPRIKKRQREDEKPEQSDKPHCTGCGRLGHLVATCRFGSSPYFNSTEKPFLQSEGGKDLLKIDPKATFIPNAYGTSSFSASSSSSASSKTAASSADTTRVAKKQKGDYVYNLNMSSIDNPSVSSDKHLIPFFISHISQQTSLEEKNRVFTLLDTGSIASNFIARRVINNLNLTQHVSKSSKKACKVCSGLDNHCYEISETIDLKLSYFCPDLNNYSSFQITAYVLEQTQIDLIVGRKIIRDLDLFSIFPDQIKSSTSSRPTPIKGVSTSEDVVMTCGCQPEETLQTSKGTPKDLSLTQMKDPAVTQTHVILASLIQESEQLFGVVPPDEDEIDDSLNDSFSPWINEFLDTDSLSLIHIAGDEDQKNKLRLLCNEFRDIFSSELPASPADIPPFELNVDDVKWKVSRNRTPPRPQSTANQADIIRQLAKLEEQGIIEKSNAAYYSQVLMVPKSDGTKRMCIDYRNLNDCTEDASWPIPNINEMLRRIGAHKAKVFATLDLTQGYHQAPLTLAARAYTAFILFCGVYQFTRLPFGPKRAPSYFQQTMATVVLAGLIYTICEMYIDDCNVFGKDTDELVFRLRLVFQRFRQHKIFLKPNKCYLGYSEIDYVGKVLSAEGLKMSQEKIRQVLDFPKPDISKQLKSFFRFGKLFSRFYQKCFKCTISVTPVAC